MITIEGMSFFAHHGCFEEEQKIGTHFNVDLRFDVDTSRAEESDDLTHTVNYAEVYAVVKQEMMRPSHLLENVARRILKNVTTHFPTITWAWVKVSKLNPPLGGQIKSVAVELETKN